MSFDGEPTICTNCGALNDLSWFQGSQLCKDCFTLLHARLRQNISAIRAVQSLNQQNRRELFDPRLCECGCGEFVKPPVRFRPGHLSRVVWAEFKDRDRSEYFGGSRDDGRSHK